MKYETLEIGGFIVNPYSVLSCNLRTELPLFPITSPDHSHVCDVKSCLRCKYATNNAFQLTRLKQTAQVGRKTSKAVT